MLRPWLAALIVATAAASPSAKPHPWFVSSARIDTSFAFDRNGVLTINGSSEEVVVTGDASDHIRLRSSGTPRVSGSHDKLTITATNRDDGKIDITVPAGVHLVVRGGTGALSVRGIHGAIDLTTISGDVKVDDAVDHVQVTTVNGDIVVKGAPTDAHLSAVNGSVEVTGARGNLQATAISGDVKIHKAALRFATATSTSGDVEYEGTIDSSGVYKFTTHSGDVTLSIPRSTSAQLTVSTWSGSFSSDFPITLRPGAQSIGMVATKRMTFRIGTGSASITADSFSGDVTIKSRGDR